MRYCWLISVQTAIWSPGMADSYKMHVVCVCIWQGLSCTLPFLFPPPPLGLSQRLSDLSLLRCLGSECVMHTSKSSPGNVLGSWIEEHSDLREWKVDGAC